MITDQKITHQKMQDGYKYFNYAILHSRRGLNNFFDTMRYDTAFFARKSDVEHIIAMSKNYGDVNLSPFSILLAKYDWRGPTKPTWTPARLLKDQEFQEVDLAGLYELNANFMAPRPTKQLRIKSEIEITGDLSYVLMAMYDNHGVPADEKSSHIIERSFYSDEPQPMTVNLLNYQLEENYWKLPGDN